jgi:hypothetical protein
MKSIAACALAGVSFLATSQALAAVIAGPTLNINDGGPGAIGRIVGLEFVANRDAILNSFVYRTQGLESAIILTDAVGEHLAGIRVPSSSPGYTTVTVNWALAGGQTYRLLHDRAEDAWFAFGGSTPGNQDISITRSGLSGFSRHNLESSDTWHAFNDITTSGIRSAVPEPSTWAMMLIGFAGLAFASRRRREAAAA